LIDRNSDSAWAHFELIDARGWFSNLLWGRGAWIEVTLIDESNLQLTPGSLPRFQKESLPPVPTAWPQDKKGMWTVPVSARGELADWIEKTFMAIAKVDKCKVTGWLDGL
jgi:hypothetical protein